jgi:hypothetical protein
LSGVGDALQHYRGGTFADHRPVGRGIKRAGRAAGRVRLRRVPGQDRSQIAGQVDRPDDGRIHLTPLQGPNRYLECPQARGLVAGDREARPAEAEFPGDSTSDDVAEGPDRSGGVQRRPCRGP